MRRRSKKLYFGISDLEKAFDRVSRKMGIEKVGSGGMVGPSSDGSI